ncbi:hypothetical protein ACWU4D_00055 [Vibrio sp. WJH972]
MTQAQFDGTNIQYWAGIKVEDEVELPLLPGLISDQLHTLTIPHQTYAMVKHKGLDGDELEIYPEGYEPLSGVNNSDFYQLFLNDCTKVLIFRFENQYNANDIYSYLQNYF